MRQSFTAGIVLLLLTGAASAQSCALRELASLDMSIQADGHLTVPVTIDGSQRNMVVDLSDPLSGITEAVVQEQNFAIAPAISYGIVTQFGMHVASVTSVPVFTMGSIYGQDQKMLVVPPLPENAPVQLPAGADGYVGSELLEQFDLDFDFERGKLNLFSHDHCAGGSAVYWADNAAFIPFTTAESGAIEIAMKLDGHPVKVELATDQVASSMTIKAAVAKAGLHLNAPGMEVIARTEKGAPLAYRYHFKSLAADGLSLNNPAIYLVPNADAVVVTKAKMSEKQVKAMLAKRDLEAPIRLGLSELKNFHFFISFKDGLVFFTAADAHRAQ